MQHGLPLVVAILMAIAAGAIAGLIFGLRGNFERISSKVFLLCPHNLVVGPEDKERIASGGFFNQS